MLKKIIKEYGTSLMFVFAGNFVVALGVSLFILPLNILSGGVAGISVALQPIFHLPPTLVINVLTVGLFLLGTLVLGKAFAVKTIMSTIAYPMWIMVLSALLDGVQVTRNVLLGTVYAGICTGVGIGLVYRVGASTGGMDIPPLVINKFTKIPLPFLVMCVDGATVVLGASTYGIEAAMIGLISVFICGQVINRVLMFGSQEAKNVMIITEKQTEMLDALYRDVNRGATILEARGGYTREKRPVIMMAITKKQLPVLNQTVLRIDPEAFVIMNDVNEVHGKGFTWLEHM